MKSNTVTLELLLALSSTALAAPQFSIPSFSIPSFGGGSGSLTGLGSLPSLGSGSLTGLGSGSIPTVGSGLAATGATTAAGAAATSSTAAASSAAATGAASSYSSGDTANDVADNTGCREVTVIFARGTSETGNVGTVAGPPMFKSLFNALGTSAVSAQGVDYPASASGNSNLGADGGPAMAKLVSQSLSQCPNSKIILSGYSQGAMVVHNAVSDQGVDAASITGAVLFGDPFNGQSVGSVDAAKVKEFCASGDSICSSGGTTAGASGSGHLSYGGDADAAAQFIQGLL